MDVYVRADIPLKMKLGFTKGSLGIPERIRDKLYVYIGRDTFGLVYTVKIYVLNESDMVLTQRWTFTLTEDNTLRGEDVARICLELP